MTGDAVKEIANLHEQSFLKEIDGKHYSIHRMNRVIDDPRPSILELESLNGLVDYILENVEEIDLSKCMVHIEDINRVSLIERYSGESKKRTCYVSVKLDKNLRVFPFGQFIDNEEFQIKMRCYFQSSKDRDLLLQYISRLTSNNEITIEDDGVTQSASVKKGLSGARVENAAAPSIITLKPYRTFREIEQVESPFIFRMKPSKEGLPSCALFEADGGSWRTEARIRICQFLIDNLPKINVLR